MTELIQCKCGLPAHTIRTKTKEGILYSIVCSTKATGDCQQARFVAEQRTFEEAVKEWNTLMKKKTTFTPEEVTYD